MLHTIPDLEDFLTAPSKQKAQGFYAVVLDLTSPHIAHTRPFGLIPASTFRSVSPHEPSIMPEEETTDSKDHGFRDGGLDKVALSWRVDVDASTCAEASPAFHWIIDWIGMIL